MKIKRHVFVPLFLVFVISFLFFTTLVLDQPMVSFVGSDSLETWKSVVSTVLSPIKFILMGPLIPLINFLHQDPDTPPPFFLVGFATYWIFLGFTFHYLLSKIGRSQ